MDKGRFQQIEQIFHSALERTVEARAAYLLEACGEDRDLRREVESLLANANNRTDTQTRTLSAAAGEGASSLSLAETPAGDMVGRKLSHYEVVEKLGEGGMGVVYKARDLRLDRFVAIKILPGDKAADPDSRKRFMREARAASALNHPHIVTIYDIASEGGTDLIVMEHVDGCSLKALIPDRGLPLNKAVDYATQMASALATAHKAGIIHRDLKPTNVMVNSAARVKILDFGLAKQTGGEQAEGTSSLTQTGAVIGTVTYMAPEQATGSAMDHRADVFSFGVTLYEMLAGSVPFRGPNTMAVLHAIVYDDPRPLRDARPDLPAALDELVRRALEKSPDRRVGSMQEVEFALRRIAYELAGGPADGAPTEAVAHFEPRAESGTHLSAALASAVAPERRAIAVMAFRCISPDKEDAYVAEGLTAEIVSALSGVPALRVVSQPASARIQESADLRALADNLNVRYILTGSLRRAGKRIRVTAELSDVIEDALIWTRNYDRTTEDVFTVQEEIARALVGAAGGQIRRAQTEEASRSSVEKLDARGLVRKAYHFWNSAFHIGGVQESLDLLRRAVRMEPTCAAAHGFLAFYLNQRVMGFISPNREADRAEGLAAADRAYELGPGDAEVLEIVGMVWLCTSQPERAETALRRAVKLAPLNLVAWGYLAMTLGWGGHEREVAEAQQMLDGLIASTPDHPSLPYWHYFKAGASFLQEDYELAAEHARICVEMQPRYLVARLGYAAALGALGRVEEARAMWNEVLTLNPYINPADYVENILAIARTPENTEKHVRGFVEAGIFPKMAAVGA